MSRRSRSFKRLRFFLAVLITALMTFSLFACGSSGGGGSDDVQAQSPAVQTVSGVAATGDAMAGAKVYLTDSTGEELDFVNADGDGNFSFDVTGLTPPFYIYATDGSINLYSAAINAGLANVNPATHLALAVATRVSDLSQIYGNPAGYSLVTQADVEQALNDIRSMLLPLLELYSVADVDPFIDPFVLHEGLDLLFDDIDFEYDPDTGVVTFLDGSGYQFAQAKIADIPDAIDSIIKVTGDGINAPESGLLANLKLDIDDLAISSSWLIFTFKDIYLEATSFTKATDTGGGYVTIEGNADVGGSSGYTFAVTIFNGSPDGMGIEIRNPDSSLLYDGGEVSLMSGEYTVTMW